MTPAPISVERLREIAYWLRRYSDDGQYKRIPGPSAGQAYEAGVEIDGIIAALLQQLAEREAEVESTLACNRGLVRLNEAVTARAESAERAREEACGLLREVLVWRRTVPPIAETPRKDGGIFGRIAAFLAASGGDRG